VVPSQDLLCELLADNLAAPEGFQDSAAEFLGQRCEVEPLGEVVEGAAAFLDRQRNESMEVGVTCEALRNVK